MLFATKLLGILCFKTYCKYAIFAKYLTLLCLIIKSFRVIWSTVEPVLTMYPGNTGNIPMCIKVLLFFLLLFCLFFLCVFLWGGGGGGGGRGVVFFPQFKQPFSIIKRQCHYENTPIQIYRKFHLKKLKLFKYKNADIFYISAQNIDCGYSLEPPWQGSSNESPQSMF